ncbi:MAG: GNAT family N-acetyltransferase [Nocardioides sp.]
MLQTDRGTVEVPLATIVTGKPVPPRASVRQRVPAHVAERHALALWPHVETAVLGEWVLRCDPAPVGRPLKRANSALALGDSGLEPAEAAEAVQAFYAARGRPAMAQVEAGSATEEALTTLGWQPVPGGDSHFQVASLATALRASRGPAPVEEVHLAVDGDRVEVVVGDGVARGRAGFHEDWLGLHGVEVDPAHRRRGLARAVVAELLDWGGSLGATTAWLHVEVDNDAALALYGPLGFRTHHSLRYLTPAGPG